MAATKWMRALAVLAVVCCASKLSAQAPAAPGREAHAGSVPEPKLVFDREIFNYPGAGRRDPFKPLVGKESLGPLFDDLKLKGIIYTGDAKRSIVLVQDGAKPPRLYRLHPGDVVGNSRVIEIKPLAVRFAVENFGLIRYEVLELRPGAAEASGMLQSNTVTPANGPMQSAPANAADAKRLLDSLAKARQQSVKPNSNDEPPFLQEQRR